MKNLAPPKPRKTDPAADVAEARRLERLAAFERLYFLPWVAMQAEVAGMKPSTVLAVLHVAVFNGLGRGGHWRGRTPIETACDIFVSDHWHLDKPIPERPIIWNMKRLARRREDFIFTANLAGIR